MEDVTKTQTWRACLLALACVNVVLYISLVFHDDASCHSSYLEPAKGAMSQGTYKNIMQLLALPYVFQTSWRCIFISEYPNRKTIMDHPLNSVLVARLLAAVGEFCFGLQLALGLYSVCLTASTLQAVTIYGCLLCIIVFDGIGQCCATYGTIVGSNFPFFLEGLLWSGIFGISLALASTSVAGTPYSSYHGVFLWSVIALSIPGLFYMVCGYCPLCWEAWRQEVVEQASPALLKNRKEQQSFRSKAWEALAFRVPTTEWRVWAHECTWQTLYFSIGTWSSLGLIAFPLST